MTTIIRGLAAGVVLAGCAIGLASPHGRTNGRHLPVDIPGRPGPAPKTIVVTSCGDGCKRSQIVGPFNAVEYHLQGDTWTAPSSDGSLMTIDNNTLAGSVNTLGCSVDQDRLTRQRTSSPQQKLLRRQIGLHDAQRLENACRVTPFTARPDQVLPPVVGV